MTLSRSEITARYRERHSEWARSYQKEYRERNSEKIKEQDRISQRRLQAKKERVVKELLLLYFLIKYVFKGKGKVCDPRKLSHIELDGVINDFIENGGEITKLKAAPNYTNDSVRIKSVFELPEGFDLI